MFAGIFDDLSSAETGVGDYFLKATENIKFNKLTNQKAGMGENNAPIALKQEKISADEGLIPQGIPGIMNPDKAGKAQGIESASYVDLEDRWTARIQRFGSANPKSGEVNFNSIKSDMDRNKQIRILTEGMK